MLRLAWPKLSGKKSRAHSRTARSIKNSETFKKHDIFRGLHNLWALKLRQPEEKKKIAFYLRCVSGRILALTHSQRRRRPIQSWKILIKKWMPEPIGWRGEGTKIYASRQHVRHLTLQRAHTKLQHEKKSSKNKRQRGSSDRQLFLGEARSSSHILLYDEPGRLRPLTISQSDRKIRISFNNLGWRSGEDEREKNERRVDCKLLMFNKVERFSNFASIYSRTEIIGKTSAIQQNGFSVEAIEPRKHNPSISTSTTITNRAYFCLFCH